MVNADESWKVKGSLLQQFVYNDNISLSDTQKQAVLGYIATPNLKIIRETKSLNLALEGQSEIQRYDNSLWDCENYSLGLSNRYVTRQGDFMFDGRYGNNCAYSQQARDTGIIVPTAQATSYNLSPSWTWQLNPNYILKADISYSNTTYNGVAASNTAIGNSSTSYIDYETYAANVSLNQEWTRRFTQTSGIAFSNTQYMGSAGSTQNAVALQSGGQYMINRNWSVKFEGGVRFTDIQQNSRANAFSDTIIVNPIGDVNLVYNGRLDNFTIGVSSTIMPSSIGQTLQNHLAYSTYSHSFTRSLSLNIDANISRSESIDGQAATSALNYNRDFASTSAGIAWEPVKDWTIRGVYSYRWQKLLQQGTPGISDGNVITLSLNYVWDGIKK